MRAVNDGDGSNMKSKQEAEENEEQRPIYRQSIHPEEGAIPPSVLDAATASREGTRNDPNNDNDSSQLTMCDWDFPWCLPKPPWEASLAGALRREGIAFAAIVEGAIRRGKEERWSIGRVRTVGESISNSSTAERMISMMRIRVEYVKRKRREREGGGD